MTSTVSSRDYLCSLEFIGIKLGLEQIRALVAALDHPDRAYRSLVIAGTNGKGSVTSMVERGLRAAGLRTGRYTSPHLVHLEERVAIDGVPIDPDTLESAAARVRDAARALPHPPSFFEATTAMALDVFREARVDIAVLEVGLGGRLDATNIVSPVAVGITAIDLDHQQYLGDTIDAIAREKAGVIKTGAVTVLGRNPDAVRAVVSGVCAERHAPLVYAPDGVRMDATMDADGRARLTGLDTPRGPGGDVTLSLAGRHQIDNALTAWRLLDEIDARGVARVPVAARRAGLEHAEWPARLEWRRWNDHRVLIDGAHNPAGARALAAFVDEIIGGPVPIVMGVMSDKDVDGVIAALGGVASHLVCTAANTARAETPEALAERCRRIAPKVPVWIAHGPEAALGRAASLGGPVVVAGSLFLAGEMRSFLS